MLKNSLMRMEHRRRAQVAGQSLPSHTRRPDGLPDGNGNAAVRAGGAENDEHAGEETARCGGLDDRGLGRAARCAAVVHAHVSLAACCAACG